MKLNQFRQSGIDHQGFSGRRQSSLNFLPCAIDTAVTVDAIHCHCRRIKEQTDLTVTLHSHYAAVARKSNDRNTSRLREFTPLLGNIVKSVVIFQCFCVVRCFAEGVSSGKGEQSYRWLFSTVQIMSIAAESTATIQLDIKLVIVASGSVDVNAQRIVGETCNVFNEILYLSVSMNALGILPVE